MEEDRPEYNACQFMLSLGDEKDKGQDQFSEATTDLNLAEPSLRPLTERYDLLAEVGRGGMGIVYRARDRETGDVVALKVLRPEIAARPELIERFKSELLLARKITHKNVCRTYDLHRFGGTAAIAMEYVEGESLSAILQRYRGVPFRRGLEWAQQICSALAEAHAQGVVHRDLKPQNILIDRQGNVKVTDFGLARSVEADATQTGAILGTPAYMAPEQVEGKSVDARTDIYSLGLVLYEMFTGQRAFQADTPVTLAMKQVHEVPPTPRQLEPDLPERIDRAIQKCLEKDPKRRFQSVAELEATLTQHPAPVVSAEAEVPLPLHLTRWQRSDWLLLATAALGLVLFFPFFDRTSLAPHNKIRFDRSVLLRITQEYAQRLGAPLGEDEEIGALSDWDQYEHVARTAGAPAAVEGAYWVWYVDWFPPNLKPTRLYVDKTGSLVAFSRDFAPTAPVEKIPLEEARAIAENALRDFFQRDPARLELVSTGSDVWLGRGSPALERAATTFVWADPADFHGLKRRYIVRLVGRDIAFFDARPELPLGYIRQRWGSPPNWAYATSALLFLFLMGVGFAQRGRVPLRVRWRSLTVAGVSLLFAFGAWLDFRSTFLATMIFAASLALFGAVVAFFTSIGVEVCVRKLAPEKFGSFLRLFDRRITSEPCGLALLRGTCLGLAVLGVDAFLTWTATTHLGMWLDATHLKRQAWFALNRWRYNEILFSTLGESLWIGLALIPFLAFLTTRWVRRPWLAGLLAAALAAASGIHGTLGALQPNHLKVLVLFLLYSFLIGIFFRYDLLTLLWAIFTFAFWWQNYRLLVMLEGVGPENAWIPFLLWGLIVLAAAAVAFQPALRSAYRRLATTFE